MPDRSDALEDELAGLDDLLAQARRMGASTPPPVSFPEKSGTPVQGPGPDESRPSQESTRHIDNDNDASVVWLWSGKLYVTRREWMDAAHAERDDLRAKLAAMDEERADLWSKLDAAEAKLAAAERQLKHYQDEMGNGAQALGERLDAALAQVQELAEALRDLESHRTGPGYKSALAKARAALAKLEASKK